MHFPLPSMNRLNQTVRATFSILFCWAFFRDSVFHYFIDGTGFKLHIRRVFIHSTRPISRFQPRSARTMYMQCIDCCVSCQLIQYMCKYQYSLALIIAQLTLSTLRSIIKNCCNFGRKTFLMQYVVSLLLGRVGVAFI
jgi:hypothetical protein